MEGNDYTRDMKRSMWTTWALFVLLPLCANGDGGFVSQTAFEKVLIPDQRALIHFASGTETLVIDTAFQGSGTNFAWIVPVPSLPEIEPATTGLFSTLQFLFRPNIEHDVPGYYWLAIYIGIIVGYAAWRKRRGRSVVDVIAVAILLVLLNGMLLPSLGSAPGSAAADSIQVLERKRVGVYDTATLKSSDARAVLDWLRQNGFAVRTNFESTIRVYAQEGWYFVASKIRLDAGMKDAAKAHPLMLKFRTERPVYPLRLTGLDNEPCRIELYVFGPGRAQIPNFSVERCAIPVYPATDAPSAWRGGDFRIRHPLLRKIVEGSAVATKAVGTLNSQQMRSDAYISWKDPEIIQQTHYSYQGAAIVATNFAVLLLIVGVLGLFTGSWAVKTDRVRAKKLCNLGVGFVFGAAVVWGLIFGFLPKRAVVVSQRPGLRMLSLHKDVHVRLLMQVDTAAEQIRRDMQTDANWIRQQIAETAAFRKQLPDNLQTNFFTGGLWCEEDSPGNCVIRPTSEGIDYVWYDIEGYPNVLPLISRPATK